MITFSVNEAIDMLDGLAGKDICVRGMLSFEFENVSLNHVHFADRAEGYASSIWLSESLLIWGVVFGSVGLGYFVYGKKQRAVVPLLCGVALMVVPYFVSSTWLLVCLGVVLAVIPYFVRA